jgi:nicotinamide riboside transporter PnuC
MRIFGRNPAVWLALFGALVSALGAFVFNISPDAEGALNAVAALVVGVITAIVVHDGVSAAVLGLIKGLFLLMVAFGLNLSAERQAVLYALAAAVLAAFVQTQVVAPVGPPAVNR